MMPRIMPRLDVRSGRVVKGIHMEGRRDMGDPNLLAKKYYQQGADELYFVDVMAALTGLNDLHSIIEVVVDDCFIPVTVAGGIRSLDDVRKVIKHGADKVSINTAAVQNPKLISQIASAFGTSTVGVSIDCQKRDQGWEVMTEYGREFTGIDAVDWAHRAQGLGAGEIVLTSIDQDGTRQGFDLDLIASMQLLIPLVVSGGAGCEADVLAALKAGADAVAIGTLLHKDEATIDSIKSCCERGGIRCRR